MTMVSGDQHFGVAGGRHLLESCTCLCFARAVLGILALCLV